MTDSGVTTQFEGTDSSSPRRQLVVGLDFGTEFTKVVIGAADFKFAVPLCGVGDTVNDYLLPTRFWSDAEGICSLDFPIGQEAQQHTDLKMPFIEEDFDFNEDVLMKAAAYLAMVIRRVRAYVFAHKKDEYAGELIDWWVNVGLPTASTDSEDGELLIDTYKEIIQAAWRASTEPEEITTGRIQEILRSMPRGTPQEGDLHEDNISCFPEFAAQITGYVRSPLRRSGLHLLVDIGAGTLDATVFNVHQDRGGEDIYPVFDKKVEPLGTRFLIMHRIEETYFHEDDIVKPFAPVPDTGEFARRLEMDEAALLEIDEPFQSQVANVVGQSLEYVRQNRYRLAREWQQGVPVFVCGGGSNCDFYSAIFQPANGELNGFPLINIELPQPEPEQLQAPGLDDGDYNRLSVAHGLSFDPDNIGEIVRQEDVDDIEPEGQGDRQEHRAPCPDCGGTGLDGRCRGCDGRGYL